MTPTADKQEKRSYLLGTLDSERSTQFEEAILCAPNAYEELLIAEEELIEQYLADGLTEIEQQQFESNFLITAERQKNLRFGQLLRRYVNSHPVVIPQKASAAAANPDVDNTARAKKSFAFNSSPFGCRPVMAFGVTAVALLGIVLLGWLMFKRPLSRSVQHRNEPVVVVTLVPGTITTEGNSPQRVNVPPKGYNLKLELKVGNPSFQNYKSELFRENKSVETRGALRMESKGAQYVVPLTITGEMLSPGDYQVKLCGVLESGANELIERYSFRIIE